MGKTLDVAGAIDVAGRAIHLWTTHEERMRERVAPPQVERLRAVKTILEGGKPGIPAIRFEAGGATLSERAQATALADAVMDVREVLKSKKLSSAELKAWGVGLPVNPALTSSVVAGARKIESAARAAGAALPRFGLKARDAAAMGAAAERLAAADSSQQSKQDESKSATRARDGAIVEAYQLAWEIGAAGALEFSPAGSDGAGGEPPLPEVQRAFKALADDAVIPSDRNGKKKKAGEPQPTS